MRRTTERGATQLIKHCKHLSFKIKNKTYVVYYYNFNVTFQWFMTGIKTTITAPVASLIILIGGISGGLFKSLRSLLPYINYYEIGKYGNENCIKTFNEIKKGVNNENNRDRVEKR